MNASLHLKSLSIGSVITYLLPPSQLPTRPDRHWHGKVETVSRSTTNEAVGICRVSILDEGYEGMREYVFFDQIIAIQ